jgi:diguanylate cyclase (GGDEF)-like protein
MNASSRVTAAAAYACVLCALAAVLVAGLGVLGVRAAASTGRSLAGDELATATLTAGLTHQVDSVYATALTTSLAASPTARAAGAHDLYDRRIPAVEARLRDLEQIHRGDPADERADVARLVDQWSVMRAALNSTRTSPDEVVGTAFGLRVAHVAVSRHLRALVGVEVMDARADQARSAAASRRTEWGIAAAALLMVLGFAGLAVLASRRLRQAMEPAMDQMEFADTLQLAGDEDEAHHLLQRHLQRLVSSSSATVLNRNNSADRLEAVTALPAGSPLVESLVHAEPRSCLAVRSGRVHDEDSQRPALMGCAVCSGCAGASTCTPLTVGGEVIGAVLLNRPGRFDATERGRIRDTVGQAAPVLANMRNLAIAELRAATDSLTGLPNKRAVADTLHRMLAQASRTLSPFSLLVLDLDRFKDLNDRFGHQVGDQALASVGAALRSALRDSDFAGRNGGEEFAVMLPNTDVAGALATAEKIRGAIADISMPGLDAVVSASIGVATYPVHAVSADRLERLADSALYVAKRAGRNRVEVAAPIGDLRPDGGPSPLAGDEVVPASNDTVATPVPSAPSA